MDPTRYRSLFLEEATDHLGEMGRAFLALEKDPTSAEALEVCFRMAHSIKGMAAALRFGAIAERAHALEDGFASARAAGRIGSPVDLPRWFSELDALERMIGAVRDTGECPADSTPPIDNAEPAGLKKKLRRMLHAT